MLFSVLTDRQQNVDSVSLNDCVLPGPALQPNLASVLIRFRTHRIGMMADVEKMYLQIKLSPKDQDVHRYLPVERFEDRRSTESLQNAKTDIWSEL